MSAGDAVISPSIVSGIPSLSKSIMVPGADAEAIPFSWSLSVFVFINCDIGGDVILSWSAFFWFLKT